MIVAPRWSVAAALHYIGFTSIALLGWDVAVTLGYAMFGQRYLAVDDLPLTLIGSALALLLSLRNNLAHARWWEARQLWGGVVTGSRNLARQVRLHLPDAPEAGGLVRLQIAYGHALRCRLRGQPPWPAIEGLVPAALLAGLRDAGNVPSAILAVIADRLAALHAAGRLDSVQTVALDATLSTLAAAQGGAERIGGTPLPRQYILLPRIGVTLFCLLLPFAMLTDLGLLTPLGSSLVGVLFLTLDTIGADLADPFANRIYDVPMTALTRGIEIDLRQSLGETGLPPPLAAVDGVLW